MINIKRAWACVCVMLFFLCGNSTAQQYYFSYNPRLVEASRLISVLKLAKASELLEAEKKLTPDNLVIDYLENYVDFYTLFISQDEQQLKKLEPNRSRRLDRFAKCPDNTPYRLYARGQVSLQWAFIHVFHDQYISAAVEFRNAYQDLTANDKKYPRFAPNKKDLGLLKSVLGSVPDNYKWVLSLSGMKGNLKEGFEMIRVFNEMSLPEEMLLEKQSGEYYHALLLVNFSDKEEAWKYCDLYTKDYRSNPLQCYLRAFIAKKCAHNDEAIQVLQHRPTGADYPVFYSLDYQMGVAKLNRLDEDADLYFKKVVSFYKGKENVKEAYIRLSWYYLVHGNREKYQIYKRLSYKYGAEVSEEEKQSAKGREYYPDADLLKARLLFDGGYYQKAEAVLKQVNPGALSNPYQHTEYYYRLGRILHEQKRYSKAMEYYQKTIEMCGNEHCYFGPNACLQMGYIHEKVGMKSMAKFYYEKTLDYKNYEYKTGITQKAKAALNKLNN